MASTATTVFVVAIAQATITPLLLSLTKQEYALKEVVLFAVISGLMYTVPTIGGTLSYGAMLGLLYWRLRPDNIAIDLLFPVGAARLLCIPVLMVLNRHAA
ncbi:hypothetical protein [Lysobacter claricitrinus]|uniref:hypothetical protein n=1 Tax=Lysobacter claricitrinus TaxID=3367728 RepID=UPI0037DAE8DE